MSNCLFVAWSSSLLSMRCSSGIGSESMIQLLRSSIIVWEAAVVATLVKAPIRDFINQARCFTSKFFRNSPLVVLQLCGGGCGIVLVIRFSR